MADPPSWGPDWKPEHDELAREAGHESWWAWIRDVEEEVGFKICGARGGTKAGSPHPCRLQAGWGTDHKGHGRCTYHGGRAVMGPDHPKWKDGAHSLLFKAGAGAKHRAWFELLLQDKELEALSGEISLLRVRLIELTNSLPGIPSGLDFMIAWGELRKAGEAQVEAGRGVGKAAKDPMELQAAIKRLEAHGDTFQVRMAILDELIEPARVSQQVWDEIRVTIKVLKDVVDTQVRRLKTEYEQASQADLHIWTMRMQELILQHVPPENMTMVVTEIRQWTGWSPLQIPAEGGTQ